MKQISFEHLGTQKTKHNFEFQELGEQLQPIYGKAIWSIFYQPYATEYKVREAHKIAQQRGITKLAYLIGIIRKL